MIILKLRLFFIYIDYKINLISILHMSIYYYIFIKFFLFLFYIYLYMIRVLRFLTLNYHKSLNFGFFGNTIIYQIDKKNY